MKRIIVISLICLLAAAAHVAAAADGNGKRTTALDSGLWSQSEWISSPDAQVVGGVIADGTRAADGASWFVNTFRNTKKITQALWMTTSLGINVAYVNGRRVGEEILKPGFTHPLKTKRSFTYDITDMLNRNCGEANTLAVQTTPGWWADKIVTPAGRQGMTGHKTAFRGVLQLTYTDGTTETFGTNTTDWLAGEGGPVTHADIFDGEEYDARRPMGFEAIEGFKTPEINSEFQGEILPSEGGEVYFRDDLILNPVEIYVWKDADGAAADAYGKVHKLRTYKAGDKISLKPGETLVVDFGQNCAGVPEFSFKSEEGANLTCLPGELLNDGNGAHSRGMDGPEGSVHRRNLRIPDSGMILRYTFADSKEASFRPECTFFGYRYVSVSADKPVEISRIVSVPISSISQDMETGTLHTGNELINRLISNTVWGQRSNYLSVPTDCPQRNERLGWMADTHVFAETGSFFADTRDFFRKWMRDVSDTQTETGAYPGVAPWAQYGVEGERMRFGWADAGVIVPWIMLKQFGDTAVVAQSWHSMESFMRHVDETGYDHTKLIPENSNVEWADWLSYEPLEWASGGVHMETPEGVAIRPEAFGYWAFLSSCYWLSDAEMMADMAEAIGKDSTPYREMAQKVRRHLQNDLINPDGTFKTEILNTMQTPALFALKNKLVDGDAQKAMTDRLRENFKAHGNCLQTGFLGTSILMNTLTENGMTDVAYELLFQRRNPSWLYSVDNGATTIWERWNSYMADKGMGPAGMNSFNHYAYGCVCEWLWKTAAGIAADPKEPGFRHIIMKPVPDPRLGSLDAVYKSPAGKISSRWKYEGDRCRWNFTVPEGARASVTLPGQTETKEYGPGTYTLDI